MKQLALGVSFVALALSPAFGQRIPLPSSKQILEPVPGSPQALNSLPMACAWSPDHRYLALVNAGFGTAESNYEQSVAILDTGSGKLTDYPLELTDVLSPQTLYSGIAFSGDGSRLYVSFDSISEPKGGKPNQTGNAIGVYRFDGQSLRQERIIPVPMRVLPAGKTQHHGGMKLADNEAIPAPTGLAVVKGRADETLLVADEYSDDVLQIDGVSGKLLKRFYLSTGPTIPTTYPIAVTASRDGRRAWVALWNGSAVAELDLRTGRVVEKLGLMPPAHGTDASSHPVAMTLSPNGRTLYVALANRDRVEAVDVAGSPMGLVASFDTSLPGQTLFGAMPDSVAMSDDGRTLYVANSGSDAVAVFPLHPGAARSLASIPRERPAGFIPTEWYPTVVAFKAGKLYVATGKGKGTGPNVDPQPRAPHPSPHETRRLDRPHTYIATMLHGSLATIDAEQAERQLPDLTRQVVESNMMNAAQKTIAFRNGGEPIKHVIYIIKENRTYDQIFGDLGVGNGDASLTMYGEQITPNLHALARQFGVLDNFYDSGEVSGDGHVWSTAAITSDYTERTWQQAYRGHERVYDFEGLTEGGYPLLEHIPDVNQPDSGYLWTDLARHGKSLYHFGEYVSTVFCDQSGDAPASALPGKAGTPEGRHVCPHPFIHKGDAIPANYGGGTSPYPWPIPLIFRNVATKPELVGHFDPQYPDFNLSFPDQLRVNEFLVHFNGWVADLKAGQDTMPSFVMLRLPNDHTAGTRPGSPTPRASVADNDLAVGRAVDAVSHSPYWDSTAFFILEDDAQDGADHVDAHRSISLVISKYAQHGQQPSVDHTFYTTVSTIHTMLTLLGVPPMNNNDAFAPLMAPEFSGAGDQPPFSADYRNRDNGLIYTANAERAVGAKQSAKMDFSHEDRAPTRALNIILWKDAMGKKPVPPMLLKPRGNGDD